MRFTPLCSVCHLMFYSVMSSLYFTIVIYVGPAWTNEDFFFSALNAMKKTEGRESYLQFGASIKMLMEGNHFSALTIEALSLQPPNTIRQRDSARSRTQYSWFLTEILRQSFRKSHLFFVQLLLWSLKVSSSISIGLSLWLLLGHQNFPFSGFCCWFAAVLGIIVLLHDPVMTEL